MNITEFQQRVYKALQKIPCGQVTTYIKLALFIDCKSPQAVGQALRRNPFSPKIPCHRVIKSDFSIGGYAGSLTGEKIIRKIELLEEEGVLFKAGRLVDKKLIFNFPCKPQWNHQLPKLIVACDHSAFYNEKKFIEG